MILLFDANIISFYMRRLRLRKTKRLIQSLFRYYLEEFNHIFSTLTKKKTKKAKMFEHIILLRYNSQT